MKFLNLLFLSLVAGNAIFPSVNVTESAQLLNSVDEAIQKYLEQQKQAQASKSLPQTLAPASTVAPLAKITTEAEARNFIKYAGAAYCAKDKVLSWNCANCNGYTTGASEVTYFSHADTNTAGYLAVNNAQKSIILGYRGTQNIVNWLFNIDIRFTPVSLPSPYSEAEIHNGFNNMVNALLQPSTNALKQALGKYPDYKVVFTGHSLGGALATLTAYRLVQAGLLPWEKTNVITYGQPRIGNPEFAAYLNSRPWTSTRVTSYADLVAISPGITFGYGHNQYNMHINDDGYTVKCSIYEEDEDCISDHLIPSRDAHFTYWDQRMNTKC